MSHSGNTMAGTEESRSTGATGSAAAELADLVPRELGRSKAVSLGRRSMITSIERQTMKKVYLRLLPFCFVLYFICYLDRVNIGFAALTMNKDLALSSYIFGLGAGAFFWGYFILEVPSNLILDRVGARRWIARIMVTWGLVSGSFAFISGPVSFFTLRFLLGLAEAGFFPGMILYFTYWFPPSHRAASSPASWRRSRSRSGSARPFRHPSSSSMASSGSLGGDGCSSARRLPQ
jgi:MFS family permease